MEVARQNDTSCSIVGRVVSCRVGHVDPAREHVIEMVMVARADGIPIAMTGSANAANAAHPVDASDVVNSTYDTCAVGADASDICMRVTSLKANVSVSLRAAKRKVVSGQAIPIVVHVSNASGISGPVAVTIPLGRNMRARAVATPVSAGKVQARVEANWILVTTPALAAGQSVDASAIVRVITPVTVTRRLIADAAVPGVATVRARSLPVTITGVIPRAFVTG